MTEIVEVFWNARPALERAGIRPEKVSSDPRAEALFDEVRRAIMGAFPGVPTLVRIAVRTVGEGSAGLRVVWAGMDEKDGLDGLLRVIDDAVNKATGTEAT